MDLGLRKNDSALAPTASAAELYLQTLDNYLAVSPNDEKTPEILVWKGNHLYNQGQFDSALGIYEVVRKKHASSAMRARPPRWRPRPMRNWGGWRKRRRPIAP